MTDGKWPVEIESKTSVRDLTRISVGRVRIRGIGMTFDCKIDVIANIITKTVKISQQ
ncbi:hypothetical protein [Pectobacterium brasiliense]|uniref:hypothetical protein n=1 Tax=Pectobacterium brasiliense TaxID=180957 RepID=UPI000A56D612|nr:hypothetical protein [Pectobacterium brasiliense]